LGVALLAAAPALAEHTRHWRQSTYEEFEKGTAKGVALRSDGKLVLAPRFAAFADPNAAYLWLLRLDSKGNLYAAGGSNAKVLRFDAQGKATKVFESAEMAAQALAIDARDNLYVGTSPDGKVYQITPGGEKKVFFQPKAKYIWDIAVDADGTVYLATGDKGEIFAVKPDGKGEVFYTSEETHIRALAFDGKGNLLAGTEPNGLILKIPKGANEKDRRAFVLYETSKKEITALLVDRSGNTYAAAIGEKTRPGQVFPQVPVVAPPTGVTVSAGAVAAAVAAATAGIPQQPAVPFIPFPPQVSSAVYRVAPDGAPEELWSSRDELVYALGFSPAGKLLLGTGNHGVVVQLEGGRVFSHLAKTASSQVTGLAEGPGGKVYLCTANPGKVFTLGPDEESEGSFESQTFDAHIFSQWGRLEWWGDNAPSSEAQIAFYLRSGNTSNAEKNWSSWAGPYTHGKGEKVECPPARFVQWKVVFRSGSSSSGSAAPTKGKPSPGAPPGVSWVSLSYLPKNVAPTIDAIVLQNPGVRIQSIPGPGAGGVSTQPVQLRMPPPPPGQPGGFVPPPQGEKTPQRFEAPPQGAAQKGWQSAVWSARDENDDELVYEIYYRGEGEKNWKLLKDKVEHKFYSWDTTTLPDGAYYLKIVASDAPSNPPEEALAAERESDRFEVDNTPPVVENLRAEPASPEVRVHFDARDSYSAIARAEYSLDAGDWKLVFPVGRLTDAPQESYELVLRGLSPGEHTLAVRVFDQFENTTSAKVTFTVPAAKR
jgi:outer membrane protein assembly factor BamB